MPRDTFVVTLRSHPSDATQRNAAQGQGICDAHGDHRHLGDEQRRGRILGARLAKSREPKGDCQQEPGAGGSRQYLPERGEGAPRAARPLTSDWTIERRSTVTTVDKLES